MKWITRERPKIDRIACPWLIARFIDRTPSSVRAAAARCCASPKRRGAIPYDIPGVELTHDGELCSFDAFLKKYELERSGAAAAGRASCAAPTRRGLT